MTREPTARSRRLASCVRGDHPAAKDQRCAIKRPHGPHPYGAIMPEGGLRYFCGGRP